jgi:membrane-bound lytic murein transglycosylase A
MRGRGRLTASLAVVTLLASCGRLVPPGGEAPVPKPTPTPIPATASLLGVHPGRAIASLQLAPNDAAGALASFAESCPRLLARTDASGLTRQEDWRPACSAAPTWHRGDAARFFDQYFESAQIGAGTAFLTGYYEPEIAGARTRRPGFDVPVYGLPSDLVRAWPDDTPPEKRTGRAPLGRYDESGKFVPYFSRGEIEDGALQGRVPIIAWAADPIELFFLEIQGSGRLRSPEGEIMRIGYAGQNGRDYVAVGSLLRQRGLLGSGPGQYPTSMQGIMQYLREHPDEGRALMRENLSYVFFQEVPGDGPLGSLGVPVRPQSSVAADPNYTPLGAPVWLDVDRNEADGLWIAQDVGGAIKGANRFDSFWGSGDQARAVAGGMSAKGQALLFLPKGTLARLGAR